MIYDVYICTLECEIQKLGTVHDRLLWVMGPGYLAAEKTHKKTKWTEAACMQVCINVKIAVLASTLQQQVMLDSIHIMPFSSAIWLAISVCPTPLDFRASTRFLHVGFPLFSTLSSFCSQECITSRRNVAEVILFLRLMNFSPRSIPRFRIFAVSILPRYVEISGMSVSPVLYSRDLQYTCKIYCCIRNCTVVFLEFGSYWYMQSRNNLYQCMALTCLMQTMYKTTVRRCISEYMYIFAYVWYLSLNPWGLQRKIWLTIFSPCIFWFTFHYIAIL